MDSMPEARDQNHLFGHATAQQAVIAAWQAGRVSHAWLITGTPGIGKATFAYHMARWVMAPDRPADALALPSGHLLYRQVTAGSAPGLLTIEAGENEKTGGAYSISVTQVRGGHDKRTDTHHKGIYHFFQRSSAGDGWRIVLIDEVDQLTEEAQNAVLKVLEEPPVRALLLLTASQPGRLLPTIRSRCRVLPLQPLSMAELKQAAQAVGLEADDAMLRAAGGSVGELARLQSLDVGKIETALDQVMNSLPQLDWQAVHTLGSIVARKDAERQLLLLFELLTSRLRDMAMLQPAIARDWEALTSKLAAVKFAHLDPAAALVDIFGQVQKMVAVAGRAA